jgi:membrane-bound lytic murein transglycosylase D
MSVTGRKLCLALLGGALLLSACDESAKKQVRARPPESSVAAQVVEGNLPQSPRQAPAALNPPARPISARALEAAQEALRSGEREYMDGHLVKARREFDRALDILLTSGVDLNSDPRLGELFEQILETVHAHEVAAFREGDGFTEQRPEPAPIDEIAELNVAADPKLRDRLEAELAGVSHDLPLVVTDEVLAYVGFFQTARGRAIVEAGLRRAGRYREMISRVLREEGVPQDLIFLAQAESGFRPAALSRARALGIWQFVASRGLEYGLKRNWWVDERRDPEKSTRAAARHMRDLYEQFGDWYLALAAYNTGPGNVSRAIERTGYADFWELHRRNVLPRETKNYVPIILALSVVAKDAERFGIQVNPEPPLRAERVRPGHPIDLRLAAETIEVPLEQLKELNPQLLRLVTPPEPAFELLLPEGTAEKFFAEIAAIPPEKWVSWRRHRVEEGETLGKIARRYRVTAESIAQANSMETSAPLAVGARLIIPAVPMESSAGRRGEQVSYRVRRGDTLAIIAEQFRVSVADLKAWNRLKGDAVARGATLKVYAGGRPQGAAPRAASAAAKAPTKGRVDLARLSAAPPSGAAAGSVQSESGIISYRVRQGETLWSIARAHQTTVGALKDANQFLRNRELKVGDVLRIRARQ